MCTLVAANSTVTLVGKRPHLARFATPFRQQHVRVSLVIGEIKRFEFNCLFEYGPLLCSLGSRCLRHFKGELINMGTLRGKRPRLCQYLESLIRPLLEKLPTLVCNRVRISISSRHPRIAEKGVGQG